MTAGRFVHFVITGALWGGLAGLLGFRAFGAPIWGGVFAAPAIGVIVGGILQSPFERHSGLRRALLALVSLFLGATLFGLAVGIAHSWALTTGTTHRLQVLAEAVGAVWWGVTLTGFFLFLWPLAYGTHWIVEWRTAR